MSSAPSLVRARARALGAFANSNLTTTRPIPTTPVNHVDFTGSSRAGGWHSGSTFATDAGEFGGISQESSCLIRAQTFACFFNFLIFYLNFLYFPH